MKSVQILRQNGKQQLLNTVAGSLLEDGVLQLQVLHNAAGPAKVN